MSDMDATIGGDGDGPTEVSALAPLPRAPYAFKSSRARQAAGVLAALLKEAGALNVTDEEIEAALAMCRTLADIDPHGTGVSTHRLLSAVRGTGSATPDATWRNRLALLMSAGAILKVNDVLHEVDVRLSLAGSLSLSIVPWLTSMSGQRQLLEALTRVEARVTSPDASADEVRLDLVDLRRVLSTFANDLRRMVDERRTEALLEYAQTADDRVLRGRIAQLRTAVVRRFPQELTDELASLGAAGDRYVAQQLRLLKLLGASRGGLGHWVRRDEVYEVMRSASTRQLADLWDGIAFDESPYWLAPDDLASAIDELTYKAVEREVPEAGGSVVDEEAEPPIQDTLKALAERLLGGAEECDLTPLLLSAPWPEPAVLLAKLVLLEGLEMGYALVYPGTLATRAQPPATRLVSRLRLRRVHATGRAQAGTFHD